MTVQPIGFDTGRSRRQGMVTLALAVGGAILVNHLFIQPKLDVSVVDIQTDGEAITIGTSVTNSGLRSGSLHRNAELHLDSPRTMIPLEIDGSPASTKTGEGEISDVQFKTASPEKTAQLLNEIASGPVQVRIAARDSAGNDVWSQPIIIGHSASNDLLRFDPAPASSYWLVAIPLGIGLLFLGGVAYLLVPAWPRSGRSVSGEVRVRDDALLRGGFAKTIAECVTTADASESFTVAVTAPWGSGKSYLLDLLENELNNDQIRVLRFNPWVFDSVEKLVHAFLAMLGAGIGGAGGRAPFKVAQSMRIIESVLLSVPTASLAAGVLKTAAGVPSTDGEVSLESAKKDIDEWLQRSAGPRLVVFMDDLDRLDKQSLRIVFKLVRLVADFPKIVYVLAYDRQQVEAVLDEPDGKAYLEKFVQASFDIPPGDRQTIKRIFEAELDEVVRRMCEEGAHVGADVYIHQLRRYWDHGLGEHFTTLRKVKVLLNSIRITLAPMVHEVNIADFVALEVIRLRRPEALAVLHKDRQWLLGYRLQRRGRDWAMSWSEEYAKWFPAFMHECGGDDVVRELVKEMFPVVGGFFERSLRDEPSPVGPKESMESHRSLRICHAACFQRYLRLGVSSSEDVSAQEARRFAESLDRVGSASDAAKALAGRHAQLLMRPELRMAALTEQRRIILADLIRGTQFESVKESQLADLLIGGYRNLPGGMNLTGMPPGVLVDCAIRFPYSWDPSNPSNLDSSEVKASWLRMALGGDAFWRHPNVARLLSRCRDNFMEEMLVECCVPPFKSGMSNYEYCTLVRNFMEYAGTEPVVAIGLFLFSPVETVLERLRNIGPAEIEDIEQLREKVAGLARHKSPYLPP